MVKEQQNIVERVLLVDDNMGTNFFNKRKLEKCVYVQSVQTATNGKEALSQVLGEFPPQLIFLDLNMPVMSGAEFLRVLQKVENVKPYVIVLLGAELTEESKVNLDFYENVSFISGKMLTDKMIQKIQKTTNFKFC